MREERLHVMFGVWDLADQYNQHIGVTITSLVMNCSLPVTVHLLYDENLHKTSPEYQETQLKYHQLEGMFGVEICYHHIELPEYVLNHPGTKQWTPAAYLRLFAPNLLSGIDWVLYLDGDIVVTCDLAEIWYQEWWDENFSVAAVRDSCMFDWDKSIWKRHEEMNVPHENYFNSGFLLMNLKKIRTEYNLKSTTEKILKKYPELPMPDQDLLNIAFSQDVKILPETYNNCVLFHPDNDYTNCIIHYIGEKPWRNITHPVSYEYWRYLFLSPWGNTPEKYMPSVRLLVSRAPLDDVVLTGRIISLRKFVCNLLRRGWNEVRGVKKFRW
ncbi:glycosyltransferase family 8 protein [Methanocorpusculum vombati]|uniref:UDP-D-xylose:beta-D-glucoside alpha-1,3-D-xylosyltransferase n=1 Tax=Methanocorpusculum vombati TaxID=3002864 RepID=A0ABT4IL26_9EURY|nr:glycosyltransferase family 8 protein [Methanocorpusculum vombati]MCZ9319074.1 glycosyltransferase family 8 protein [Methanocorpusculum sp.]MCZ0862469.1 glycosyltransferase family 8 protein [Methanocorpusculum vombati]MDE2520708.1 glycosyltransferase family 8 protein [Methanocorpusculum sp.]MDE2534846.1 glycosyltransferase family 8 protein [Methanocorpusculum sp.]MDE2545969.1 glycosyltransferase family 8 protein [Methanocorpusculum sp.]